MSNLNKLLLPSEEDILLENPRFLTDDRNVDNLVLISSDKEGNELNIFLKRIYPSLVQCQVILKLAGNNHVYRKEQELKWTSNQGWCTNDIQVELVEPMRLWRICFSGLLHYGDHHVEPHGIHSDSTHYIKFYFLFHPNSCPVFYSNNGETSFTIDRKIRLIEDSVIRCYSGYEQWGMLHGEVYVDGTYKEELNMNCLRRRYWCGNRNDVHLVVFGNDGIFISLQSMSHRIPTRGHVRSLRKHELALCYNYLNESTIPSKFTVYVSGSKNQYTITNCISTNSVYHFDTISDIICDINGKRCRGFLFIQENNVIEKRELVTDSHYFFNNVDIESDTTIVDLTDELCLSTRLVGGKAVSLAKLFSIRKDFISRRSEILYNVPAGFCITVNVMEECVKSSTQLGKMLYVLCFGMSEIPSTQIKHFFQRLNDIWHSVVLPENLRSEIAQKLDRNKMYAVRSSGILEDSAAISCAGQNNTYLNVPGLLDNILESVKLCWASLYSFMSVQYRREHGAPLITKMGVIIQEMVQPDTAGVLFTCDPLIGDLRHIVISYCSGLGEAVRINFKKDFNLDWMKVVSGLSELSTVYDKCTGNIITDFPEKQNDIDKTCNLILEENGRILCKIGSELEKMFNTSLDIEWAILNGTIYLLQCRPITTIFSWTDFEIAHELDSAYTEYDSITFYNCQEVTGGVTSPLSLTFTPPALEESFIYSSKDPSCLYHKKLLATIQFRMAINLCNGCMMNVKEKIPLEQKIVDLTVCGQVITTEELYNIARIRNGTCNFIDQLYTNLSMLKIFLSSSGTIKKSELLHSSFEIRSEHFSCPKQLLQHIHSQYNVLIKASEYHLNITSVGSLVKCLSLCIITGNKEEKLTESLALMTSNLSHGGDVVSAEAPSDLQKIAQIILANEDVQEFLDLNPYDGLSWLKQYRRQAYKQVAQFLDKYGFRGVKEVDLMAKTWGMNPQVIISMLQSLVRAGLQTAQSTYVEDNFAHGNKKATRYLSNNFIKQWVVNWLLLTSQKAVAQREITKRSYVSVIHQFRLAFRKLSKLLYERNLVPDEDIMFYLTYYELHRLIYTTERSIILHKGIRRRRMWKQLDDAQYPDIIIGLPKEKKPDDIKISDNGLVTCKGFPVTSNSGKGRCCVLQNVDEGSNLLPGDILVTRVIDVGWSPYFPMLSGIITELGGFVSHGAVVAREYGLPCLISVSNATSIFHTGETIMISGTEGIARKIQITQES